MPAICRLDSRPHAAPPKYAHDSNWSEMTGAKHTLCLSAEAVHGAVTDLYQCSAVEYIQATIPAANHHRWRHGSKPAQFRLLKLTRLRQDCLLGKLGQKYAHRDRMLAARSCCIVRDAQHALTRLNLPSCVIRASCKFISQTFATG